MQIMVSGLLSMISSQSVSKTLMSLSFSLVASGVQYGYFPGVQRSLHKMLYVTTVWPMRGVVSSGSSECRLSCIFSMFVLYRCVDATKKR